MFALSRSLSRNAVRILCYHGLWIGDGAFRGDSMFMSGGTFEQRLDLLRRKGYRVVPLDDAVDMLSGRSKPIADSVVITIDDGWYSTFRDMLPALRARSMPATIYCDTAHLLAQEAVPHVMARYFVLAAGREPSETILASAFRAATDLSRPSAARLRSACAFGRLLGIDVDAYLEDRVFHYMTPMELRHAAQSGFDIQLHTHNHTLGDMSAALVIREVEENRRVLASLLGRAGESFRHFCYPSGLFTPAVGPALEKAGVVSATTLVPGLATGESPPYALPRFCDGENVTAIEFEAELSGFSTGIRRLFAGVRRLLGEGRSHSRRYGDAMLSR